MDGFWLSVKDHGVATDELDLLDRTKHRVLLAGGKGFRPTNQGTIELDLLISGADPDDMHQNVQNVIEKLVQADRAYSEKRYADFVTLGVQLGTTDPVFFDVYGGNLEPVTWHVPGTAMEWKLRLIVHNHNGIPLARGAVDSRTVSGTLTNGAAAIFVDNVPGDLPADVKLTLDDNSINSKVIQRFRISRRAGATALGDWDPVVDVAALSGASTTADASAVGGSYVTRTLSSTNWVDIARATMPVGALNTGKFDVWARIFDAAGTPTAPSSFNGVPSELPTMTVPGSGVSRRQTAAASASSATVSPSWPSATLANSLLVLAVKVQNPVTPNIARRNSESSNGNSTSPSVTWSPSSLSGSLVVMGLRFATNGGVVWTPPTGWTLVASRTNSAGATDIRTVFLIIENAPTQSGSVSGGSFSVATSWSMWTAEYTNAKTANVVVDVATGGESALEESVILQTQTSVDNPRALYLAISGLTTSGPNRHSFSGNLTEIHDSAGLGIAELIVSGDTAAKSATITAPDDHIAAIMVCLAATDPAPRSVSITPPSGYGLASLVENFNNIDQPITTAVFYQQGAPAESGAKTVTFNESVTSAARLLEYTGIATSTALLAVAEAVTSGEPETLPEKIVAGRRINVNYYVGIGPTAINDHVGTLAVAVFGAYATSTTFAAYGGNFSEAGDSQGMAVADATGGFSSWSSAAIANQSFEGAHILLVFKDNTSGESAITYPGQLQPGTYQARIQAVTSGGYVTSPTSTITDTITNANAALVYTWNAPALVSISHYRITVRYNGVFYVVDTPTSSTTFTITTLDSLGTASAFPTTGVRAAQRVRARIGTAGSGASSTNLRPWHEVVSEMQNAWHLVYLGTFDLPPQSEMRDNEQADWAIEIQGRSGGGASAALRVDALFLFSSREPGLLLEYDTLDLSTACEWIYEAGNDGRAVARLENSGSEVGQIQAAGRLTLMPGGNIIAFAADIAGGVSDTADARFTAQLDIYPYYLYQKGA